MTTIMEEAECLKAGATLSGNPAIELHLRTDWDSSRPREIEFEVGKRYCCSSPKMKNKRNHPGGLAVSDFKVYVATATHARWIAGLEETLKTPKLTI